MPTTVRPIGARVMAVRLEDKSDSKIIVPEAYKENGTVCQVVALGTQDRDKSRNPRPFEVAVGDKVVVGKYAGTTLGVDGKEVLLVETQDILAVVT